MGSIKEREYTKKQLQDRESGLIEVVKVLDEYNIPYRIAAGSLLGFYRDGGFIPWDNDVDLFFDVKDIFSKTDLLLKVFEKLDFEVRSIDRTYASYSFSITKYGSKYEFSGFHDKGKYMVQLPKWNVGWKYPKDLFNRFGKIAFSDREYTTFQDVEGFLFLQYGDWSQKRRSRYLTYKVRVNYFNPFIRVFLKIKEFRRFLDKRL